MEKVITPAVKEISRLDKSFINFKCEPLYAKRRGKPLTGYKFTWQAEQPLEPITKELPTDKPSEPPKELTQEEKDKLIREYGPNVTEDYIQRTTQYHCCNYATIRKWIAEDKEKERSRKPKKNTFNNIPQHDYDFDELEKALLKR